MRKTFTFFFVVNQTIDQPKVIISDDRYFILSSSNIKS
jgi:hypothetical protein